MTKQEAKDIMSIAKNEDDMSDVDVSVFAGCGLPDFGRVYVTKRAVAALFRFQALQLNGEWDSEELNQLCRIGRTKFIIIDECYM